MMPLRRPLMLKSITCTAWRRLSALLVFGAVGSSLAAQSAITVAVVPQTTQGFIDTDAGIRDSIADIQKLLRESGVRVVDNNAQVTLVVLGREMAASGMTTSLQSGGVRTEFGGTHPVIHSKITVGTYEKVLRSEVSDALTWKVTAKQVVKDLLVWIDANRERLK